MTREDRERFAKIFDVWFRGDHDASSMCLQLLDIAHLWDDLIDRDKPIEDKEIDRVFCIAIFELPANPFWQQHHAELRPVLEAVYSQWKAANVLEMTSTSIEDRAKSYVLRAGLYQLFVTVARLTGGRDWCIEIAPMVWRFYGEHFNNA